MDAVDVGLAGRLLRALMPQGELRNELDAFNARGHFHNLVLSTTIEEGMLATGQLLSNINDASLSAHRGAPAFWGVDGYVEVDFDLTRGSVEGFVDVDAHDVMMQLPNLFDAPWAYDSANGRVRFSAVQGDELQMKMVSSVIVVESDIISARGQFSLDVETGPDRFMNLELMIGALQVMFLFALLLAGGQFQMAGIYYLGLLVAAGLLVYQQWLIRDRDTAACFRAFLNNHWVGLAVFAGVVSGV